MGGRGGEGCCCVVGVVIFQHRVRAVPRLERHLSGGQWKRTSCLRVGCEASRAGRLEGHLGNGLVRVGEVGFVRVGEVGFV